MEFWLMQDNDKLRLPINPESFEVSLGKLNTVVTVANLGELNLLGKSKLATISIASFFPNQLYGCCSYTTFPKPYDCVTMVKKFMELGQTRLLITGTNINQIFYIDDFTYGERDGTGDVYYTINFREYRPLKIRTISTTQNTAPKKPSSSRPGEKSKPKTYKVKKGDTLWAIAKKYYGQGSKYPVIAKKNNIKNPNRIYPGQVLKI